MKKRRQTIRRREPLSAMQQLEASLETMDEVAWYAERIEQLGMIMFGGLWNTEKAEAKTASENSEPV